MHNYQFLNWKNLERVHLSFIVICHSSLMSCILTLFGHVTLYKGKVDMVSIRTFVLHMQNKMNGSSLCLCQKLP